MSSKNTPGMSNKRLTKEERRALSREKAKKLRELEAKSAQKRKIGIIVALCAVVLLVALLGWKILSSDKGGAAEQGSYSGEVREVKTDNITDDGGVLFDQSLTATATESGKGVVGVWADYMCSACERFDSKYGPLIEQRTSAGDIQAKIYAVNTLRSDFSTKGATAFYYVAQYAPDKAWEFNKELMKLGAQIHEKEVASNPSAAELADIAKKVGVSDDVVNDMPASIMDEEWQKLVEKSAGQFRDNGFTGTPTLTVNGQVDDSWLEGDTDVVIPQILDKAAGK